MKRQNLHPKLKLEYKIGGDAGVVRSDDPKYANTWFLVPPAPPEALRLKISPKLFQETNSILSQLTEVKNATAAELLHSSLLVRREAVQSSRMEGTWSTINAIFTPADVLSADEEVPERSSVIAYAHAVEQHLNRCASNGVASLNGSLIKKLHLEIMRHDPGFTGKPGEIRKGTVFIGGALRRENSIYNPPIYPYISPCLAAVMKWYSNELLAELGDAGMGMPLVVRMAIGHAHFEAVHPFLDGNGRVGRMLMNLQMACSKRIPLYLSGFIEREKKAYTEVLIEAQQKLKYEPIVEFIATAIVESHREAVETKNVLQTLPDAWMKRGQFRRKSAAERSLSWLIEHPIFTAQQLELHLDVSPPAAHRAVQQLLDAKIIRERTGKIKNRSFATEEVIELLGRNFAEKSQIALDRAKATMRKKFE